MNFESTMRVMRSLIFVIPVMALSGCFGEGEGKPRILATPLEEPETNGDEFVLVFADEFDVDGPPSPSKWNIETGYGPNNDGNGNNEWQLYTDSSDNVRVEGGNLVISALCPTPPCGVRDGTITSGKITTQDKFEFRYGRVEARIKPPVGKAAWPAFWALGANHPDVGWPRSGEIDFMEMHNAFSNDRTSHFTIHWCDETIQAPDTCSFPQGWIFYTQNTSFPDSLGDDFHIFEAEWDANRIVGKIDGITYFTRSIEPGTMEEFLREFYMILNVAMGGTLGSNNQPPDGTEVFPQTMLVDYVRVYQREGDSSGGGFKIDFEDDGGPYTFNDFEGGVGFVTDNPDPGGINDSAKVAQMWKFAGADFAGTTLKLDGGLDVPTGSTFTMKVWSPREVNVLFKPEGGPAAELNVAHGGTGWEELVFPFPAFSGNINGITFIFDLGVVGDSEGDPDNWTFYIDDIELIPGDDGGGGPDTSNIDFEDAGGPYVFNDFEGGVGFVTDNPHPTGINTSAKVAQMWKFAGAVFAGTTLKLPTPYELDPGTSFNMKVWSPRQVQVLFKLEGAVPAEVEVTHGGTGWEELTFDFPGASGTFTGITFIFDLGTVGDAEGDPDNWTFYIDDIERIDPDGGGGDPGGGDPGVVADFEDGGGPYVFNDFEGGVGSVVDNPDPTGINTSARVGRMQKFAGAVFAGTTLKPAAPLEVVAGSSFTMKVWSPRQVDVLFKLEGNPDAEVSVVHGGTGWELLTFEFPGVSGTFSGITLIFDIGIVGDAGGDPDNWTFYFDDITQVPPDGGGGDPGGGTTSSLVADFEGDPASYDFGMDGGFGGGAASVVDNPDPTGINTSAQVGQMLKYDGEVFGGATLMLADPLELPTGSSFTMKVWSQRSVDVLFKIEGPVIAEIEITHGGTGWEELSFPFPAFTGTVEGITLIFDLGVAGAAATDPDNWTFYFDDITLIVPGGGGMATELADFEGDPASYDFGMNGGFGGGAASVVDNPDPTGINTSAQVGRMLKYDGEVFGGATLALPSAIDVPVDSSFTMKVWSQRTVDVLFKLEGPMIAELEVTHGGTGWEELTFPFPGFAGSVEGITQIYDLGVVGAAGTDPDNWTFYFDDITWITPGGR